MMPVEVTGTDPESNVPERDLLVVTPELLLANQSHISSLGDLEPVEASVASLVATAESEVGGDVWIDEWQNVTWGEEVPVVRLSVLADLTVYEADHKRPLESAVAAGQIDLYHTDGVLQPGRRYQIFLGVWDDSYSMLYAHDIETDLPAPGFDSVATRSALADIRAAQGSNRDAALSLAASRGNRSAPEEASRRGPNEGPARGFLPQFEDELEVARSTGVDYSEVEVVVLVPPALQGELIGLRHRASGDVLGWFESGSVTGDYVVISGYLPATGPIDLVKLEDGDASIVDLRDFGARSRRPALVRTKNGFVGAILDLASQPGEAAERVRVVETKAEMSELLAAYSSR